MCKTASGKLLYNTGSSAQGSLGCPRMVSEQVGGREAQEAGNTCLFIADSGWCTAETTQHCKAIILQFQKMLSFGWKMN